MRIGVVSDTHLRGHDEKLRQILEKLFRNCDLVLHAGDLVDASVLDLLGGRDVRAVHGNADPHSVKEMLPASMVLNLSGLRLGLIHDCGLSPSNWNENPSGIGHLDCLVFGHTHRPVNCVKGGVLYFNPGSATSNRFSRFNSVGIIEVGRTITGQIIELRDN